MRYYNASKKYLFSAPFLRSSFPPTSCRHTRWVLALNLMHHLLVLVVVDQVQVVEGVELSMSPQQVAINLLLGLENVASASSRWLLSLLSRRSLQIPNQMARACQEEACDWDHDWEEERGHRQGGEWQKMTPEFMHKDDYRCRYIASWMLVGALLV